MPAHPPGPPRERAVSALKSIIRTQIETSGPMRVSDYMQLCLTHPRHGYYSTRDPLGVQGDFTTAPEISQLFGELIGAWLVAMWHALGAPDPFALVELGPGRGTLIADIVRTARHDAPFEQAMRIHLVETSTVLRARQRAALAKQRASVQFHGNLDTLPALPTLWVANEFFDALPTDQWVRTKAGWNARRIGLGDGDRLIFGVDPTPRPAPKPAGAVPPGTIIEHSPAGDHVLAQIAARTLAHGGAGLIIDYGSLRPGTGDTLQAVRAHAFTDPLDAPGMADLTTHVDFDHLARCLTAGGITTLGAGEQGAFLLALGLLERAGQLGADRDAQQREAISLAVERLAGDAAMGKLFKVLGFVDRPLALPGLAPWPFVTHKDDR